MTCVVRRIARSINSAECFRAGRSSENDSKRSANGDGRHTKLWLQSNLRVRIVDPKYKKGKYYKVKVSILYKLFSSSHPSASTLRSVSPMFSIFCHLSRHPVSGLIVFHQVSPSQLWSASVSLSICNIFLVASSLSRLCKCPNHLELISLRI